jgi:hypothetical protein
VGARRWLNAAAGGVGGLMTRGTDVVAVFVQRHPDLLKSPLIRQELADLISTALTEAYELGRKTMIREIVDKLAKEVQL